MTAIVQASLVSNVTSWPTVVAALSLVMFALILSWWWGLRIEWEVVKAAVRAAVQLLAVGFLFALIFGSTRAEYWAWGWVVAMAVIATVVVYRQVGSGIPGLAVAAGVAVGFSAIVSIAVTFGLGVIEYDAVSLVVVVGITIGNAVPSAVLGVNRSVEMSRERVGELEALLATGFDRRGVVRFMSPRAARIALMPQVERTKVVGLIALPGAMTGLLLAGVDPVDAVLIQLLVMYLVLGTAALCVVATVTSVVRSSVTPLLRVADWVRIAED